MHKTRRAFAWGMALLSLVALFACAACSQPVQQRASSDEWKLEVTSEPDPTLDTFYALFIGNDSRYGTIEGEGISDGDPCFGDTLMLARIDPRNLKVSLLSIPRDTYCEINGDPEKINANHYLGGADQMVDAVEDLTGVHISYYFDEHFVDFGVMIDNLSGVNADVPIDMHLKDILNGGEIYLEQGADQHLDGPEALVLVRQRKQYADNMDACRQVNARQVVQNAIRSAASGSAGDAFALAAIVEGTCETNMDGELLAAILEKFTGHADEIEFQLGTGPYAGSLDEERQIWCVPRDEATYAELVSMMENGGDLTSIVELPELI